MQRRCPLAGAPTAKPSFSDRVKGVRTKVSSSMTKPSKVQRKKSPIKDAISSGVPDKVSRAIFPIYAMHRPAPRCSCRTVVRCGSTPCSIRAVRPRIHRARSRARRVSPGCFTIRSSRRKPRRRRSTASCSGSAARRASLRLGIPSRAGPPASRKTCVISSRRATRGRMSIPSPSSRRRRSP